MNELVGVDCKHEWENQSVYGVWNKFGFGVMDCATCKKCQRVEYVSFSGEDPAVDVESWKNPLFEPPTPVPKRR